MGANISTVEDSISTSSSTSTTISHAVFAPTNTYKNHKPLSENYNNSTINIEIEGTSDHHQVVAPLSTPNYHSNYKPKSNYTTTRSKSPPSAALVPSSKVSKLRRVIYFHSSPTCRGYLEASKASNTLIVIDFTNGWCGRCRYMEPTLHEFAAKYTNVEFLKIDVDELSGVAREYGVEKTPTFLLMKKGKVIDKVCGANKEELQNKIDKYRV